MGLKPAIEIQTPRLNSVFSAIYRGEHFNICTRYALYPNAMISCESCRDINRSWQVYHSESLQLLMWYISSGDDNMDQALGSPSPPCLVALLDEA